MIVNLQETGWEVIYHRAHALLAAQIAGYWDFGEDASHRLYETIVAISHHDDLEKEWEGDQLTEAGAPLDFMLERDPKVEDLRRHADEALYRGRWVAMLTSMHLSYLNAGKASADPDIAEFLDEQLEHQAQWRKELGISKDKAASIYDFMRWCDRMSLILCQRQVPMGDRVLEVTTGPDGQDYFVRQLDSGDLAVEPWPFKPTTFTVEVEACILNQLKFQDQEELSNALKNAPRQQLTWTFRQN